MPTNKLRKSVPVLIASAVVALVLSACGGSDSSDEATSALAKYVPADAVVYVEGSVRPDQELADNVNELATKLTGKSLSDTLDEALAETEDGDVSYDADVEPWLGEDAALYVGGDFVGSAAIRQRRHRRQRSQRRRWMLHRRRRRRHRRRVDRRRRQPGLHRQGRGRRKVRPTASTKASPTR